MKHSQLLTISLQEDGLFTVDYQTNKVINVPQEDLLDILKEDNVINFLTKTPMEDIKAHCDDIYGWI